MIRGYLTLPDGRRVLFAGLSAENIKRLKEGKPIMYPIATVPGGALFTEVVIAYGETEDDIRAELAEQLPEAVFVDMR